MSGVPTGCSDVPSGRNMECPTRREPHGYGAVIVVRPGEGPGQGKGPQDGWKPAGRRARCTKAKTGRLPAATRGKSIWKATCMESVHAWFGEGRTKKGRTIGTSSAAYSTVRPQLSSHMKQKRLIIKLTQSQYNRLLDFLLFYRSIPEGKYLFKVLNDLEPEKEQDQEAQQRIVRS